LAGVFFGALFGEVGAAEGHDGLDFLGHLFLLLVCPGVVVLVVFFAVEGETLAIKFEFFEVDHFAVRVQGDAVFGELVAGGFAVEGDLVTVLVGEFAVFEDGVTMRLDGVTMGVELGGLFDAELVGAVAFGFAVFVGEDAVEVGEEAGFGFGIVGEGEGALLNDGHAGGGNFGFAAGEEVVELIDSGGGVVDEVEGFGEEDFVFVAVEGAEIQAGLEFGPDFLLGVLEGFGAEDIVDVIELIAGEGGEFGEGFERAGALALAGMGWRILDFEF
jgi:hypothetical protein